MFYPVPFAGTIRNNLPVGALLSMLPPGLDRLCADLDLVVDQQLLEPGVHEGGQNSFEVGRRARLNAGGPPRPGIREPDT